MPNFEMTYPYARVYSFHPALGSCEVVPGEVVEAPENPDPHHFTPTDKPVGRPEVEKSLEDAGDVEPDPEGTEDATDEAQSSIPPESPRRRRAQSSNASETEEVAN